MARLKQFQALEEHGYDRKEGYRIISCPRGGLEEELDALRDNPSPWVLINANLNQSTLERLVRECGHRLERLILFPKPRDRGSVPAGGSKATEATDDLLEPAGGKAVEPL